MSAVAAVLLALCAQDGLARVQAALDAGDFAAAWERQVAEPDPHMAARGRCEILYRAGDPAGALAAAQEGLRLAPLDLELLHRASSSALWLGDAPLADALVRELGRAIGQAALAPEERPAWDEAVRTFEGRVQALTEHDAARERAVRRARTTSCVALATALAALLVLAAGRGPGASRHGRSSSPVS
jgi:hypothetical protein